MPEKGVSLTPRDELLSEAEIIRVTKLLVREGVIKVRITGREPIHINELSRIIGKNCMKNLFLSSLMFVNKLSPFLNSYLF